ncbi:hypothetical protein ABZX69_43520 [Streptomyces sp. NPDC004074]|uniref:hypothetical protein n=1 Tax=unclassified Streptomyces TaxID=2593676 RepID=UPI0033AE1D03
MGQLTEHRCFKPSPEAIAEVTSVSTPASRQRGAGSAWRLLAGLHPVSLQRNGLAQQD